MVRTGRLSMQQRKGVRLGPTPGRNRNASNRPGQQSTILQNEHSQHLPNGLHEEHVKATASCCAPVTWTFSALEYLSLSSTTSQSTHHRECRGNSFRKLTWQHKELIIFPPPPQHLYKEEMLRVVPKSWREAMLYLCRTDPPATCLHQCKSDPCNFPTKLQTRNINQKDLLQNIKGGWNFIQTLHLLTLTHPVQNFFITWDVTLTNDIYYSPIDLMEAKDIYVITVRMDIILCCWLE